MPASHPSHTLWKSLRDYHIPTASTAGIFQGARARETECKAFGLQGGCTNGAALPPLARWQQRTSRSVRRCCAMPNQIPRQSIRTGTLECAGCSARVHEATAADEARLGVNPMKSSSHRVGHRAGNLASRTTTQLQMVESSEDKDGGRYRI